MAPKSVVRSGDDGLSFVPTNGSAEDNAPFSPLRVALNPAVSAWTKSVAVPTFRPTLISPEARDDDNSAPPLLASRGPPLPPLKQLPPQEANRKRVHEPSSFLPYKKRIASFHTTNDGVVDTTPLPPTQSLRAPWRPIAPPDEHRESEAAAILLQMKQIEAAATTLPTTTSVVSLESTKSLDAPKPSPEAVPEAAPVPNQNNGTQRTGHRAVTPPPTGNRRLALPDDANELNSLHCFVRSDLLELFALPSSPGGPDRSSDGALLSTSTGRVGLRCVHCAHLPRRERAGSTMSTFYPKCLNDIYRSVCTWQRIHFRTCRHIPPQVRENYWTLKEQDRTRGKTRYWVSSAERLGLADIPVDKGGVWFKSQTQN